MSQDVRRIKLTSEEQRLLRYPPTETTWYCEQREQYQGSDGEMRERVVSHTNAGTQTSCWLCGSPKPRRPKLAWPVYQEALAKVAPPSTEEGAE